MTTKAKSSQDSAGYYSVRHPEEFHINWRAFYNRIDRYTLQVRSTLKHHLDIAYGRNPKQRLDVYLPSKRGASGSVLVFLHGGAFSEGDRAHYGYVAGPFAKQGVITIVPSYRLTPEFKFPDQPEDMELVLAWVHSTIKDYGGNADRIYMVGHSSGAILASFVSCKRDWLRRRSLPWDLVKGCVLISGNYDLRNMTTLRLRPGAVRNDYAPTRRLQLQASPILHIESPPERTLIALGSLEEKRLLKPACALADEIMTKGAAVEVIVCDDLDHDGIVISLGSEESKLTKAALTLMT